MWIDNDNDLLTNTGIESYKLTFYKFPRVGSSIRLFSTQSPSSLSKLSSFQPKSIFSSRMTCTCIADAYSRLAQSLKGSRAGVQVRSSRALAEITSYPGIDSLDFLVQLSSCTCRISLALSCASGWTCSWQVAEDSSTSTRDKTFSLAQLKTEHTRLAFPVRPRSCLPPHPLLDRQAGLREASMEGDRVKDKRLAAEAGLLELNR